MFSIKRMMRRQALLLPSILLSVNVFAQKIDIRGTITDSAGEPLPGAAVMIKGTTSGTISDNNGNYVIRDVDPKGELEFSSISFRTETVPVAGRTQINVVLEEDSTTLEEVVVVGYGVQKVGTITGSVAQIKSDKLAVAPVANVSNLLAGRMPGLFSLQSSGLPGSDAASLSIRGFGAPLVIVDGVESQFSDLNPEQIEAVSILKDGAASIYGARAGNGVILVTTKRGVDQRPTVSYNGSLTLQGCTKFPKNATSAHWAEMEREAFLEGGGSTSAAPWTKEDIEKFAAGNDPNYPNTDWFEEVFRDWAPQHNHSISLRGGSNRISYFGYIGYLDQQTMVKKNGGGYSRVNLQSNVDMKVLDNLNLSVDLSYNYHDRNYTQRSMGESGSLWQDLSATKPYYPASFPDPTKIPYADGAGTGGVHVGSNRDIYGYSDSDINNYHGTATLKYDFKSVPGLTLKLLENCIRSYTSTKEFIRPIDLYIYDNLSKKYTLKAKLNGKSSLYQNENKTFTWTQQLSLNYDKTFGKHHVSGVAVWELLDYHGDFLSASRKEFLTSSIEYLFAGEGSTATNSGSANELGRESAVCRLNYGYAGKYLAEFIMRADASSKFAKGYRWGFFPSVSVGWVISKEEFLKGVDVIDNLKIRASYGMSGDDSVVSFAYLSGYNISLPYQIGNTDVTGISSTGMANPTLSWETMKMANAGIDFSFFNRALYGSIDGFYRLREGIPAKRHTSIPSTFGESLPLENLNSISIKGFDLMIGTCKSKGEFTYDISANLSWYQDRWAFYDEPDYDDPDKERIYGKTGHRVDELMGYKTDGLLANMTEISKLGYDMDQQNNVTVTPGSIKLVDLNGDGVVNWLDQTVVCNGNSPRWTFGINANFAYREFDLNAVFQGAFGYSVWVNNGRYTEWLYENRWSPQNQNPDALYPHLAWTPTDNYVNDFNIKKVAYIRLKTMSIGYNLPKSVLASTPITNVRFYFAGNNLLTFSTISKFNLDPESITVGQYYPQQRTLSLGVNISF